MPELTPTQTKDLADHGETPEFRWGDTSECSACGSQDIDRQTASEGRPFSCNNCGLEFFTDTGG